MALTTEQQGMVDSFKALGLSESEARIAADVSDSWLAKTASALGLNETESKYFCEGSKRLGQDHQEPTEETKEYSQEVKNMARTMKIKPDLCTACELIGGY